MKNKTANKQALNRQGESVQSDGFSTTCRELILRFPKMVLGVGVILVLIASAGMAKLTNNPDNRVFFGKDNPHLQALEALEDTYTKTDNVFIALAPVSGSLADPKVLTAVRELTEAAWKIPYSSRVDSLSNFQHTLADGCLLYTSPSPRDS